MSEELALIVAREPAVGRYIALDEAFPLGGKRQGPQAFASPILEQTEHTILSRRRSDLSARGNAPVNGNALPTRKSLWVGATGLGGPTARRHAAPLDIAYGAASTA
jgi:hypothetical protein